MVTWMRKRLCCLLVGLSLLASGCSLVTDATCLAIFTVRETAEDFHECARNRKLAESAWADAQRANPRTTYSEDYACGFKDGFAQYLYRGGNGEPPPLPPPSYRKLRYQTPRGYQAIEEWYEGFRHGAMAARQSGYRRWITGPSALHGHASVPGSLLAEPELVSLERPIPLEMTPPPSPLPAKEPPQASNAPPPPPPKAPGPTIINGEAAPLPTIINGQPRSLPPPD